MHPHQHPTRWSDQDGFTYFAVLLITVVLGGALTHFAAGWQAAAQREKERQLLFAGNQFRNALLSYYAHSPPNAPRHPISLEQLLADPRTPVPQRHLRRVYSDPLTGKAEWGLVRGAGGEIYGVHSLSNAAPLKRANFNRADRAFASAKRYSEWVFMFTPAQAAPALATNPMEGRR